MSTVQPPPLAQKNHSPPSMVFKSNGGKRLKQSTSPRSLPFAAGSGAGNSVTTSSEDNLFPYDDMDDNDELEVGTEPHTPIPPMFGKTPSPTHCYPSSPSSPISLTNSPSIIGASPPPPSDDPFVLSSPPPTPDSLKRSTRSLSPPFPSSPISASTHINNQQQQSWTSLLLSALRTSTGAGLHSEGNPPDSCIDRSCVPVIDECEGVGLQMDDGISSSSSSNSKDSNNSTQMKRIVSDLSLPDRVSPPSTLPPPPTAPPIPSSILKKSSPKTSTQQSPQTTIVTTSSTPSVHFHGLVEVYEFNPHPLTPGVLSENLWWRDEDYKGMRQRQRVQEWCKMVLGEKAEDNDEVEEYDNMDEFDDLI